MEPQQSVPRPSSRDRFGMNSLSRKGSHDQTPEPCSIPRPASPCSMLRHSISRRLRLCISTVTPGVTPSVWINAGRFGPLDARQALQSPISLLVYHKSSLIICLYCFIIVLIHLHLPVPPALSLPSLHRSRLWSHISSSLTLDWM